MQVKQNTCPQLVAAGCVRSFKHNAHRPYADDAGESGMPVLPPPPPPPPHVDEGIPELPPTPPDYDSYPDTCTAETPLLASPIRSNSPSPTKCRKSTRTRRRSLVTSDWESGDGYREPSLRSKLRQGMSHTFGHE
mmetsp:Transcript_11566/g.25961  ORF Transcript_11566/g.25961 Transcript_11566/m.25961 type:complete len:135 (+) Transcript_11566:74-478(+)